MDVQGVSPAINAGFPFPAPELWMCRVYPPLTVQGFLFPHQNYGCAGCIPRRQCRVSFSSTKIMDVQGLSPADSAGCPFPTPELWTYRVYPTPIVQGVLFQHQNYGRAGCIPRHQCRVSFSSSRIMDMQVVSLSTTPAVRTCRVYSFPPSAVGTCRVYPSPIPAS